MPHAVRQLIPAGIECGKLPVRLVLMQSGKSAGLSGAISGAADTFLSKNKAKSWDAKLARWTKWVAIGFMILTMVLTLMPNTAA